ncbi:hypothetical protein [Cellulosimicrobium sp. NPDC057127]|uniref:hypothetical protein n=1 Tax=Cellulosimicrobium sp. NPDC057127 TaxID=3346026 RepID=UPI00363EB40F
MRSKQWAVLSAVVLSTAVVGACSAGGDGPAGQPDAPPASTAAQQPSPTAPAEAGAPDDAAVCTAVSDVMTILENADVGLAEGRMEAQEHGGWYRLATRVLDRLPSSGTSAVQTAIGDLQESTVVDSPAWGEAQLALGTACDDVGAPLAITMFTGG